MSNPNAAFGLRATATLGRANTTINEYAHPSGDGTALFIGDPVVTTAEGGTSASSSQVPDGTPYVIASGTVTNTAIRGAVALVRPTLTNLTLQYGAASTEYGLYVHDDPNQLFTVMSNGTVLIDDISDTMGLTSGSGSTTTGLSAYVATESTGHSDNAYVLRIIRMAPIVNNILGANSVLQTKINLHELTTTTTA